MSSEFIERRHITNPDYDVDLRITGVRLGTTGNVNWHIHHDENLDPLLLAQILERVIIILEGGGENREETKNGTDENT